LSKKIVVLGAGYAGALTAKKLEKKLKGQDVDITIIDKNPFFTMLSELHEVAAWRVEEDSIRIDLKKIFAGRNVNVVLDNIVETDFEQNKITGKVNTYEYDYLVMASGCKSTYWGVPGAEEHTFPLWSYDEAVNLRLHIYNMFSSAARELDPKKRKALLTFYVVGAGFTGVEMIAELAEFVPIICQKFHIDTNDVSLNCVDALDKLLPFMPDKAINRVANRLKKLNINLQLNSNITNVTAESITFESSALNIQYQSGGGAKVDTTNKDNNKVTITDETYTVIWTAGIEGSDIALHSEARLGHVPRSRGRIQTDKYLRSINHANVYVAGDNTFYIPEGEEWSVPQMVEHCEHCAPLIAANIVDQVNGKEPTHEYKPQFHGSMVSVGGRYASAHVGMPGKFFVLPSLFAMLSKHAVAMLFFLHLIGWNKIFAHVKTQFFTIRNRRSILGGHFSNRSATFMTVPLRIWMGGYLIYYAYVRFVYDWLNTPVLADTIRSVANEFRPVFMIPYTHIPAEINFMGSIRFSTTMGGSGHSIFWLQTTPVSWFIETFVIASTNMEIFWQTFIVLFCLLIGLALMGGFLTTLASIATMLYTIGLLLITGLPIYYAWLVVAPLVFIFSGANRSLSLDYYFIPWFNKKWKSLGFVKKLYIFND